jgi:branched-chain amino acid aminotransferase
MALACIDGTVGPAEQATIPATDEGLLRGDGAFEVLRLYRGRPFALEDHLRRLERSSVNLRLPADVAALGHEVEVLLAEAGPVDGLLRLVVTRGGRRLALIEPLPPLPERVRLGYVTYTPTRVLEGVKSLSYAANMLAMRLAQERGFDDALLVTPHGRVLEGPTSSFFWVSQGRLRTPPLSERILGSITRGRLLDLVEVAEEPCTREDAAAAEEAFVVSTVREVMPVSGIEEVDLPAPGPVTAEAARRLRERIELELSARDPEGAGEPA